MEFDDQLWSHLVDEYEADQLKRPRGSRNASGLPSRSRRRRAPRRWLAAPAIVVVALVVVTIVALLGTHRTNAGWSQTAIHRAAAFIAPPLDARQIVHIEATITRTPLERSYEGLDRNVTSISEDAWMIGGPTPAERAVLRPAGGDTYVELNGLRFYDVSRRLEIREPTLPATRALHYRVRPGHRSLRVQLAGGRLTTVRVSYKELVALRRHRDIVEEDISWNGRVVVYSAAVTPRWITIGRPSSTPAPNPASTGFAADLHVLLNSGTAHVLRTTLQDGRRALQIYSAHPQDGPPVTYFVDPTTYAPIELVVHNSLSRLANTTIQFHAYQRLPLSGDRRLLHFTPPTGTRVTHAWDIFLKTLGLPTLETSVG